ncbi:hypothetical protein AQS70_02465 [Pseudomonas endophytica]|uniref:YhdP central domain-containing protein n=1 Tax=Pseudomonas endophytica TaxID=1563157 RepID=A0A0Q0T1M7_9PSED|nr:YhdP family protein [Pseudomonas endophytica]KQB53063.1 hypothetical protein AQS70_02465 [Pseudomonas endophytica]
MERLTRFFAALTRWGLGLCALVLVLTALYVSLGRELTPLIAEYRAEVQTKAREALGMPLTIGSLEGSWKAMGPVLNAHDVMVGEGNNALRLDNVQVVPDVWGSLLHREVRLARVQLDGLQLSLRQDQSGHWSFEGLPVQDDQPLDPEQLLNQLQRVARVSILDSQVTLEPFEQAPLTLTYVGLTLDVGASDQRLDARLTLPDGQPMALSLKTQIQASRWREGAAQAYLSVPQSDWAKWLPVSLIQPWKVSELKAGGEFWFNWGNGTVQSAVARLNAPKLSGAYADRKPESLDNLALHAWLEHDKQGLKVVLDSLAMNIGEKRWESRMQLQQFAASDNELERWHLQADHLDLTPLTALMDSLAPVPEAVAKVIDELNVTGTLRNVLADYRPEATDDEKLSFAANLQQVGFNATHGAPAARNVSGLISGDLGKGELRLDSKDFVLHLDPIFDKPWQYLQANALLKWTLDKNSFTLVAPYIKVLGEEGKIAADFLIRIHMDHSEEDYMDLRVGLTDGDGRFTSKYLPEVLSPSLSEWLNTAIIKGSVEEGFFQYQGSLSHDAVDAARSVSLFFKVHGVELAFQPGWPHVRDVSGDVFIEDSGVRIMASKGKLLDTQVRNVAVNIPHVNPSKVTHLFLDGDFDGKLADGLRILQEAPLGTESTFAGWQGEGSLKGRVDLDIPLEEGHEPKIVVDFNTDKARLKISDPELELTQLKGDFRFDSAKGLSGKNISGRAFDQPIKAQIYAEGKSGKLTTRVVASGQVGVKKLTDWLNFNQPIPVSGMLPYQLQLTLDDADSQLRVSSSLKGATIDLPAPFGLGAGETRDTIFRMTLQGAERRYWFDYGNLANLTFAAPNGKFEDGRGELFLGYGAPVLPATKGLRIRGVLSELDVAPWQALVERYAGKDPGGNAKQLLSSADFKINKLIALGTQLDQVRLQLQRGAAAWNLQITSQQATGAVTLPDAKNAPIKVTMQTIRLPAPDPKSVTDLNAPDPLASVDPRQIPALDIMIRQLYQGADLLGAWSLNIRPTTRGVNLNNLSLGLKGLLLEGSGGWEGRAGASNSWYKGRIGGGDLAGVLKAWGFAPSVTSEKFKVEIDGRWPGSPAWIGLNRFSGTLDATLNKGRFVEVDGSTQVVRIFGLLNFNAIGRRLRLDFSDLFGKGLSYDRVKGFLVADNGVYRTTSPILMTGPSTNLELNGTLNMVSDQVDAKMLVTLPVTNNLPLAALLVGGPAAGGAMFLLNKLIGDKVSRFASVQYSIQGPWNDPKITFDKPF